MLNLNIFLTRDKIMKVTYFISLSVFALIISSCGISKKDTYNYRTKTESMIPSIYPGYVIYVDTTHNHIFDYGDIVRCGYVHFMGEWDLNIFRIIGLPGDSVGVWQNAAVINGKICENKYVRDISYDISEMKVFEEILPGPTSILISKHRISVRDEDNFPLTKVPENHYFVLGDNRSYAVDSRYNGFIHKDSIHGKVINYKK